MIFIRTGSMQERICTFIYRGGPATLLQIADAMSMSTRRHLAISGVSGLVTKGMLILDDKGEYSLSEEVTDIFEDRQAALKQVGILVEPCRINRMALAEYVPPKIEERRAGCFDFKTWPSRGGD